MRFHFIEAFRLILRADVTLNKSCSHNNTQGLPSCGLMLKTMLPVMISRLAEDKQTNYRGSKTGVTDYSLISAGLTHKRG